MAANKRLSGGLGALATAAAAGLAGYAIKKGKDFVSNLIKSRKSKKRKMSQEKTVEPSVVEKIEPEVVVQSQPEVIPFVQSQPEAIPVQEELPFVSDAVAPIAPSVTTIDEVIDRDNYSEDRPVLVPVAGNPKVMRCLNCKTFVSASADHTFDDCNVRLSRKEARKHDTKSTSSRKRKSKKVDKKLIKSFRKLEKENAKTTQLKSSLTKKASVLMKKYKTQNKKAKLPKQMLDFLEFVTKKFH